MAEEPFDEKTEPATPRKRGKAREEGTVARSQDLTSAAILLVAVLFFYFYVDVFLDSLLATFREILGSLGEVELDDAGVVAASRSTLAVMAILVGPVFGVVVLASLAINLLQVGFAVSPQVLAPDPNRMNPIRGLRRILGGRAVVKLILSVLKLLVIAGTLFLILRGEVATLFALSGMDVKGIVGTMGRIVFEMALWTSIALLVIGLLDYMYQRWQYERDIRMTRQEVRDELKTVEGDPTIRARRRQIQVQMARQRMMQKVPTAQVVVTNPTLLAVAIAYESQMTSPRLVAKGAGRIAERIREIAEEHGIPIVERKPLARALFEAVEIGDEVPEKFWQAIAEVLAFVYRLGKLKL